MTVNQQDPSERAKPGTVTRVFRSIAPAILWITLANGTVLGTTPDHEVWTHEDGWTSAKRVEVGDSFATRDGSCVVVTDVALDPTPTVVFNLDIAETYTYFVSDIWVHNCPPGGRFTDHAKKQMGLRGVGPESVEEAIAKGRVSPGNEPGRSVYDLPSAESSTGRGVRVVVDDATGEVVTVIDRGSKFK